MNDQLIRSVKRAADEDVFPLLSFLHAHLPDSSPVYANLLSLIGVPRKNVQIYFIRSLESYTAVVGIKREKSFDPDNVGQSITWIVTEWTTDEKDLIEIYKSLEFIDWTCDGMKFFRKGSRPSALIQNFFADKHRSLHHVPVNRFTLDPPKALIIQSKLPGEVYVTNLQRSHARLVHHHWIPKVQTSIEDVADDIDHLHSAGVFLKENDQLVSWVVTSFVDGFSKLHTLEQYRHRGYATLAVQYLAKQLARSGLVPFVYIVADNEVSIKLFQNVGFQFQCESHIVKLFAK